MKRKWTDEERAVLFAGYPNTATVVLAERMGRTARAVYMQANLMALKKSGAYMLNNKPVQFDGIRGGGTRFQAGHQTWNKGINFQSGGRSAETQFKKGRPANEARNYVPLGSLRVCADGYLERKLTDDPSISPARRWVAVHRIVWEAAHGPIAAGKIVVFKCGMKTSREADISAERLDCITRAENAYRNHPRNRDPELGRLVQLKGQITRQVNRINRESKNANTAHQ